MTTLVVSLLWASAVEAQYDLGTPAPWQSPPNRPSARQSVSVASRPSASPVGRVRYAADAVETPQSTMDGAPLQAPRYRGGAAPSAGPSTIYDDAPEGAACGEPAEGCGACETGWGCEEGCDRVFPYLGCRGPIRVSGEALVWWTKAASAPPLVTSGPAGSAGLLDQNGTTILVGGVGLDPGARPGGRFSVAYWFCPCEDLGIEATFLFLSSKSFDFSQASANDNPILSRPFFNAFLARQDAVLIASPNVAINSSINVDLNSELQSFELVSRDAIYRQPGQRVDFIFGYRYGRFIEGLGVNQAFTAGPDSLIFQEGTLVQAADTLSASNEFHGLELGIAGQARYCRWSLEGLMKLALGGTRSHVTVDGSTTITVPGVASVTTAGALLAQPTNIGRYSQTGFSVMPEVGLTVGYNITRRLRATVGYSLLYWSQIARPGDQIDAGTVAGSRTVNVNVNPTQFSGGALNGMPSPQYRFVTTDFWAQGISAGLDWRF